MPDERLRPGIPVNGIDLTKATPKSRNMLGPMLTVKYSSRQATTTSLGGQMLIDVNVDADKGTSKPDMLHISDRFENTTGMLMDIVARPTKEKGPSTVAVRWAKKGREASIDLQRLLMVRRLAIPHGQRALVSITRDDTNPNDPFLIFHFSEAQFAVIEPRRTRSKKQQAAPAKQPEAKEPPASA